MCTIKLIALDMDGTLLDDEGNVSKANREAIAAARAKGVDVVLSAGRYELYGLSFIDKSL